MFYNVIKKIECEIRCKSFKNVYGYTFLGTARFLTTKTTQVSQSALLCNKSQKLISNVHHSFF